MDADRADADRLLGPEGCVAEAVRAIGGRWEDRPQQREAARAVEAALSSTRHLVVEAGTGVGKSFAYLVPLLAWAEARDATVAVATSTIALQEQLVRKDLPLLVEALPFDVSFALVKGRGNYLCRRRLSMALEEADGLFAEGEEIEQLRAIRDWSATTEEGSRQDLPFRPRARVWDAVRAEQGNCKGRMSPYFGGCPYQRSRRAAHTARCLVINHHLLMSDLALRRTGASFLPDLDAIVIDEAHDLEDTAAQHLGARVSDLGLLMLLGRLWQPRRQRGVLARAGTDRLRGEVEATRRVARGFFEDVRDWGVSHAADGSLARLEGDVPFEDHLGPRLRRLARELTEAAETAGEEDWGMELAARARSVEAAGDAVDTLLVPDPGCVRWVEVARGGGVAMHSAPVDVGSLLGEVLWDAHDTVVLTSATLATGRPPSFAFVRRRLGLEDADELGVDSPFDFVRQARLIVRDDLPDPVRQGADYEASLPDAVREAVALTGGGAFVLFTGYTSMRRTAAALREDLEAEGLAVLVQGEDLERPALLERFRAGDAVLFGVSSFWQGVDVPGDALRHVVIARLPFEVPTHPLQRARAERIEAEGGDPFRALSLPAAALRLKQGFGRLIRTATDRGVVTILDPRVRTRSYGRVLLDSLPVCGEGPLDDLEPDAGPARAGATP